MHAVTNIQKDAHLSRCFFASLCRGGLSGLQQHIWHNFYDTSLSQTMHHAAPATSTIRNRVPVCSLFTSSKTFTSTSTDTLLPLIGTAAVVKIFTLIDNSSNRHGESFKTVKNIHFFLCQNMAQNHVGVTAFSTNNCPWKSQPAAVFAIQWLRQATTMRERAPNVCRYLVQS